MTILPTFPVIADIVPPPPPLSPQSLPATHTALDILPYFMLAVVAIGTLLFLRRKRASLPGESAPPVKS